MLKVHVREADLNVTSDSAAFIELLNAYILDEMGGGVPVEGVCACKLMHDLRRQAGLLVLFAGVDGQIAGMAVCFQAYATFRACPLMNIHDLIVRRAFRARGIGRLLMAAVEERARVIGCGKLTLEVRRDNVPARKLYASLGYGECNPPMSFWIKNIDLPRGERR